MEPTHQDLETIKSLLDQVKKGVAGVKDSVHSWRQRQTSTSDLTYPTGISLLSLKNHLLLSYLSSLLSLFSHKLLGHPIANSPLVLQMIKLRIFLEKIGPLEGKLKYQIEKLVRKVDVADEGGDDDVLNDPLAFRPNPSNLVMDRQDGSDDDEDSGDELMTSAAGALLGDSSRSGLYRPPRIAAMPYTEGPSKRKSKEKRPAPSHMISDISTSLSSSAPSAFTTSGLSVSIDPSQRSSTARHLEKVREFEEGTYNRMRMSKKDSKKRRNEEEEVAFGGLGAGKGGRRRLGGYGAEFDELLGNMERGRGDETFEGMKRMKRVRVEGGEGRGSAGVAGLGGEERKGKKNAFDRAVGRAGKSKRS